MGEEDRWGKLEEIVRRVVREEIAALRKEPKSKVGFKNGQFTGVGEIELAALEAAYPAVEVQKQIAAAAAWICMNPGDAPSSNYGRFLNTWLGKAQNQASLRAIGGPRPTKQVVKQCAYCGASASGNVNGIDHCRNHTNDAMDNVRPLGAIRRA